MVFVTNAESAKIMYIFQIAFRYTYTLLIILIILSRNY